MRAHLTLFVSRLSLLAVFVISPLIGPARAVQSSEAPAAISAPTTEIWVTTTDDDIATNGNCTLREAVLSANSNTAVDACPAGTGADTIRLPNGLYQLSLEGYWEDEGWTGDLDIQESVIIAGDTTTDTIVDANYLDRAFHILPADIDVQLSALTVKKGELHSDEVVEFGVAIANNARLTLDQVLVTQNGPMWGIGTIYNTGVLTVTQSSISHNYRSIETGGGILNTGTLTVIDSQINDNREDEFSNTPGLDSPGSQAPIDRYPAREIGAAGRDLLYKKNPIRASEIPVTGGAGVYNSGTAYLKNCHLDGNAFSIYIPDTYGGALYNEGTAILENCTLNGAVAHEGSVIFNVGSLVLNHVTVSGGTTRYGFGEAIATGGTLSIIDSQVRQNGNRGISGGGKLWIERSTIEENHAISWWLPYGGAGIDFSGTAVISGTTISNNEAGALAGGILGSGQWTILNSAIISNTATRLTSWYTEFETGYGAGIYWNGGILTVTNTTISGNYASDAGAGVFVNQGEVRLESVTMANNQVELGSGGGLAMLSGTARLHNTLLAANIDTAPDPTSPDCYQYTFDPATGEPVSSTVTSMGFNLVGNVEGCSLEAAFGDQIGTASSPVDPQLLPLDSNGSNTLTHALLPSSPAVDTADAQAYQPADQRGVTRPQGVGCDIGAFELEQDYHPLVVAIDIRPGNPNNVINPNSQGTIPVAILSTSGFYAPLLVNRTSLTFGRSGNEASLDYLAPGRPNCKSRDANHDRVLDLVCRFSVQAMEFQPGDTHGTLRGELLNGELITGEDSVQIRWPTTPEEDEIDTQLDLHAYEGSVLVFLPLLPHLE